MPLHHELDKHQRRRGVETSTAMPHSPSSDSLSDTGNRKRVRISEARPAVVDRVITLSEQERNESWWTANDFAAVKDSVKRQCRDHRKSRRYSDCLTDAYAKACVMAAETDDGPQHQQVEDVPTQPEAEDVATTTTADSPDDGAKGSLVEISPPQEGQSEADEPDEGLVRWLEDEGPRGLEGYSSRLHAMRRQRHLQDTKHAVFLEQARQNISNERDEEQLARQASMASRRARTFATLLGQADAWAASRDGKARHSPEPNSLSDNSRDHT